MTPEIIAFDGSFWSGHGRVKPFITFTPVVDVSISQQQEVVQATF
jgi:hypothetical protein